MEHNSRSPWNWALLFISLFVVTWGLDRAFIATQGQTFQREWQNNLERHIQLAQKSALFSDENEVAELLFRSFSFGPDTAGIQEARFLNDISSWIRSENLTLISITSLPASENTGKAKKMTWQFDLELEGDLEQWNRFLHRLEHSYTLAQVNRLVLQKESHQSALFQIGVGIELSNYHYQSGSSL